MLRVLLGLLILLAAFLLLFFLIDMLMKGDTGKTKKAAPQNPKPDKQPAAAPTENAKTAPVTEVKIYNSNLADELDATLKNEPVEDPARLEVGKHIGKRGNIAQYIQNKNYHSFDFENHEEPQEEAFTLDDYKRIVALSNIDDKK